MNRYITKEETQMSNKHMKRCSTSYTIMELQIKKNKQIPRHAFQNGQHSKDWQHQMLVRT